MDTHGQSRCPSAISNSKTLASRSNIALSAYVFQNNMQQTALYVQITGRSIHKGAYKSSHGLHPKTMAAPCYFFRLLPR